MGSTLEAVASDSPLLFLSWGVRRGESHDALRRAGWSYLVIEMGVAIMSTASRRKRVPAPALVLVGPKCQIEWAEDPTEVCKHFAWVWARPVHAAVARLPEDAFSYYALTGAELTDLRQLHASSRHETYRRDQYSDTALTGVQFLLEARVARIIEGGSEDSRREVVERALDWIQTHASARQPLARLADFLGMSPATVQRLFRARLGTTVMKSVAEIRLREAERLLAGTGASVKEVAYHLGYRHPHDFSRAFRNRTGKLPSRWLTSGAAAGSRKREAARVTFLESRA